MADFNLKCAPIEVRSRKKHTNTADGPSDDAKNNRGKKKGVDKNTRRRAAAAAAAPARRAGVELRALHLLNRALSRQVRIGRA